MSAELEALEYIWGLDAMGGGLGPRAWRTYQETIAGKIYPLRLKQKALLGPAVALGEAGVSVSPDIDARVVRIEEEIERAWEGCLVQLKAIWLGSGAGLEDFG